MRINTHDCNYAAAAGQVSTSCTVFQLRQRKILRTADSLRTLIATDEQPATQQGRDPHQSPGCRTPWVSLRGGAHAPPSNSCVQAHRQPLLPAPSPPARGSPPAADQAWASKSSANSKKTPRFAAPWREDRSQGFGLPPLKTEQAPYGEPSLKRIRDATHGGTVH